MDTVDKTDETLAALRKITKLEKAFRYLESRGFPNHLMELTPQDEFSHDVVIPFPDKQTFLALGVT